ncbi:hypothetical protein HK100_006925, partial [Physocladia obscura]
MRFSDANFPLTADGRTYHVGSKLGDTANLILTVGDPARAALIAQSHLQNTTTVTSKRGFVTITGNYRNHRLSIVAIGMGMPMMDFFVREVRAVTTGPLFIIRFGSCGSISLNAPVGSVAVVTEGAVAVTRNFDYFQTNSQSQTLFQPYNISGIAKPDFFLTNHLLAKISEAATSSTENTPVSTGINVTADSFYSSQARTDSRFPSDDNDELLNTIRNKFPAAITLEMETFMLLHLANSVGVPSLKKNRGRNEDDADPSLKIHAAAAMMVFADRVGGEMKKTDVPSSTKLVSKGNKRRRPEIVAVTKDHEIRGNNKQTTASNEETFDDMIDDDGSGDDDDEDDDDDDDDENNDGNGNNNNNDDVDSVLDDSENDNAPEKPAAKKPRVAAKSSDSRYKLPTTEEIHALKETTDLFQSNLFKLQIDELLREATPDYTKSGPLDKTLHAIKNVLDSCESTPSLNLTDAIKTLRKHGVEIPFSRVDGPSPETTKYTFSFVKPSKVFIAGSYLVKTITKSRHGFNVDVAVHMPDDGFTEKDHLNNRYFHKRAYYLAVIAAALKESPAFNDTEISFQLLNKDPRRPVIAISLPTTALAAGFAGPGTAITIRVIPVVSPDLFSVHKLAPGRNNNRPSTDLKNNGSGSSIENFPPTPRYNSAILMDTGLIAHLNAMHSRAAA